MAQTTYTKFPEVGLPGANYDLSPSRNGSYVSAEEIPFGRVVAKDAGVEKGCKLPDNASDLILGVAQRADGLSTDGKYAIGDTVAVKMQGTIFVELEEDMTTDDAVYVRHTSGGGGSALGKIRNDADTATAVLLPGARLLKNGTAGKVVPVILNLP